MNWLRQSRCLAVWYLFTFIGTNTLASDSYAQEIKDVELAVYSSGLGFVREERLVEIPAGRSTITVPDIAAKIDPTSVHVRSLKDGESLTVIEQRFAFGLTDREVLLKRYVGREVGLGVLGVDGLLHGTLSDVGRDVALTYEDGRFEIIGRNAISRIVLPDPPTGVPVNPSLVWTVQNEGESGRADVEITYLTEGLTWHAEYVAVIGADKAGMQLSSWASIENQSGATFQDADLTLVAGDVNRVNKRRPGAMREQYDGALMSARAMPQFDERKSFEYHVYDLSRPGTIKDRSTVQLAMLRDAEVSVSRHYVYDGAMRPGGVQARIRVENTSQSGLGDPLPSGVVRLYQEEESGGRLFIGEDQMKDLARDEVAYLTVGQSFDILGERTQVSSRQPSKGVIEENYRITLRNHSDEAVSVKVIEHMRLMPNWSIRSESHTFEKTDSRTVEFDIPVNRGAESTVTYTVVYRRGM